MIRRRHTRAAGRLPAFTLLEVMVALALLAGALMAIYDLVGNALRNHVYARELTVATLLARGKMAELEQKYEDSGFREFDEDDQGDFSDEGRSDVRWHVDILRPNGDLSADQIIGAMGGGDSKDLIGKLMGSATTGAAATQVDGTPAQGGPTTAGTTNPLAGAVSGMIQSQLTAFGEVVKKSFREMRLTVSWGSGKGREKLTVTTHLLVLNPKAPGGARGDNPDVPPNIAMPTAAPGTVVPGQNGMPGQPGVPGMPGVQR